MSFYDHITPKLGRSHDGEKWYVEAMCESLNGHMADLETALSSHMFLVSGVTVVPGTPPVTVPISAPAGRVVGNHVRLTVGEVEAAMWCGDGSKTFPNLFSLFATKLMANFNVARCSTVAIGTTVFALEATQPFTVQGNAFMAEVTSLGTSRWVEPDNVPSRYGHTFETGHEIHRACECPTDGCRSDPRRNVHRDCDCVARTGGLAMNAQTYNNYWKLDLKELPTRGKLYPKGSVVKIRPLNVQEIKYLATMSDENATDIVNEILEKCLLLDGLEFPDVYLGDREYFAFWVRVNSFTKNSGYDISIKECERCRNPYKANVKLTDFDEKYIVDGDHTATLPDAGVTLKLKYPTIRDSWEVECDDVVVEDILLHLDVTDPDMPMLTKFVEGLSALDYGVLSTKVEEMRIGFNREMTIHCPLCGHPHTYTIEIGDRGLMGSVNLFEVMDLTLRLSKSMNFQIQDTMPWMEVELLQEAANAIAEEEKKQLEKESKKISLNRQSLQFNK